MSMRKIPVAITLGVLLVFAGCVPANLPKISIDRDFHDFGQVKQFGGTVSTNFTLKNTGAGTLEIGKITTSCSCTSAKIEKSKLEPNESTKLTVTFDPNLHEEPKDIFKRIVFIPSNDPQNSELQVTIQVDIVEGQ